MRTVMSSPPTLGRVNGDGYRSDGKGKNLHQRRPGWCGIHGEGSCSSEYELKGVNIVWGPR